MVDESLGINYQGDLLLHYDCKTPDSGEPHSIIMYVDEL